MSEWELLKENVEPIKSGRSIKTLKSALNEEPNELNARELKRKEFESELRTYSGSDLLSVYYDYILWIEQNYPLGGNEANLKTLLEKCLQQFFETDQYRNDERLLQVFLKFIKRVDTPLELFAYFHDNGFATKLSQFYINWSFHLENQKNCRKAAEVLREGLAVKAQPIASLQSALEELEVRVAKAVANNQMEELNDNDLELQRKPLNSLKSKTKKGISVAPVKRVGTAIRNTTKGLKTSAVSSTQSIAPVIYSDENNPNEEPKPKIRPQTSRSVSAVATVGQENEQKPGKWSENVIQQQVVSETQPKFTIHADDSDDELPEVVRKPPESNTLKIRPRGADSPPIARFEKPNPFISFVCNLKKMYAGGEEFSFEEIRGRKWMQNKKREEEALRTKRMERELEQLRAQVECLMKAQQQMSQQNSQPVPQIVEIFDKNPEPNNVSVSPPQSSADSSAKSMTTSGNSNEPNNANSLVRDLWNGTLGNQTTDVFQADGEHDINNVLNKNEEQVQKKKELFTIFADTTILSKAEDKPPKPRESTGFIDYSIALPKSEQTFIANTCCSSTPVADKTNKNVNNFNVNAVESLQNNYNFVGGMTAKLSPIVETSREYNSKSSSSGTSSGTMSTTGGQSAISRRQRALSGNIDPFDECVFSQILETISEPINKRKGLFYFKRAIPKIKLREKIKLGSDSYLVEKLIATGAYAKVYSAQIAKRDDSLEEETTNSGFSVQFQCSQWFALKVVRNANEREFYICDELQKRLNRTKGLPDIELSVMSVNPTVMYKDGCILVDEFAPNGTLLDVVKACKPLPNTIVAYFTLELLQIINRIHKQHIIHADIKPDNILVLNFPSREEVNDVLNRTSCLKIIDFGRSIDMELYSEGQTFNVMVITKGSECCEMLDKKPWTYQTDWFGVLDCIHVMLFNDYIKVNKKSNKWEIRQSFKRYHLTHIWKPLFDTLLNIRDCNQMPDLTPFIEELNKYIKENVNQLIRDSNDIETLNDSALKTKK